MSDEEKLDNFIARHRMYEEWEPEEPKRKRSRGNGEGSIRKRENGTFEGRFTEGFIDGKQIVRSVYGKTRKECNDKMQEAIKEARERNIVLESKSPVLRDWLLVWLNEYRKDLAPATRTRYTAIVDKLDDTLCNTKLAELLPISLQQFINGFHSHEMAKRAIGFMKASLGDAMNNGFIQKNPAAALRNPIASPAHKFDESKKAFTHEEENAFVKEIENNPYKLIYQISLWAGLRRGEATALQWENIDLEKRLIHVKEAVHRGEEKGYSVGKTKTVTSIRTVPISPALYNALSQIKNKSGFVCPNSNGKVRNADVLSMDFRDVMKRLNQKHTFHHLRHTFATRCIVDKGINPKVVQTWLGHATIDMTMNTYTHATEDFIKEESKKLL